MSKLHCVKSYKSRLREHEKWKQAWEDCKRRVMLIEDGEIKFIKEKSND